MKTHPMKLVTIVTESLIRDPLVQLLGDMGAHGWTLRDVQGSGSQGERLGDIAEFGNIKVEVIVPPAVAEQLLDRLQREFFPRCAMVAYTSDIQVLRPAKF
jgi:nitrogen regulatory protein PII